MMKRLILAVTGVGLLAAPAFAQSIGEKTGIKAFAAKHLPHLKEHLKMAQDIEPRAPAQTMGAGDKKK